MGAQASRLHADGTPAIQWDNFIYRVNDGALDSNTATVTLAIGSVNDAPADTSTTVTTLEDTPYVYQLADIGYSDANDAVGAQASRLHADGTSAFQENSFIQHECRRTIRYNLSFIIP